MVDYVSQLGIELYYIAICDFIANESRCSHGYTTCCTTFSQSTS